MIRLKTIHDVEQLVMEYMTRHNMKWKHTKKNDNSFWMETFCFTTLEAKLTANGRISFKVDGKRTSIYK